MTGYGRQTFHKIIFAYNTMRKSFFPFAKIITVCQVQTTYYTIRLLAGKTKSNKIKYETMNFVCSSAQVLTNKWYGGDLSMRRLTSFQFVTLFFIRVVMLPYIALVYWFMPWTSTAKKCRTPVNKFLNNAASYTIFIMVNLVQVNQWLT